MLSKMQSKYIRSLAIKKIRQEQNCFVAEGEKIVLEWLAAKQKIKQIFGVEEWLEQHRGKLKKHPEAQVTSVSEGELKEISTLQTPNKVLIVVEKDAEPTVEKINSWTLALDGIRDPGNMGTLLRIADWFGIEHIVCSEDCVDTYSPKVIQAAMGAHLRVNIYEENLSLFLQKNPLPKIAAVLGGENIYQFKPLDNGILIIGNEAKGISENVLKLCQNKVMIPKVGGAESLNAGVSAGILCALLIGK